MEVLSNPSPLYLKLNSKNMRLYIYVFLLISLFNMCCPDEFEGDCSIPLPGITTYPDSHSISYLQNYQDNDEIVFLNQDNDTIIINVTNRIDSLAPIEEFTICEFDTTMNGLRTGFWDMRIIQLQNSELDINLFYRVWNPSVFDKVNSDLLWINDSSLNIFINPLSSFQTYNSDRPVINRFTNVSGSKIIGNKTYTDVIEPNKEDTGIYINGNPENGVILPNPWVMYNREFGLLSIKDTIKGYELKYLYSK